MTRMLPKGWREILEHRSTADKIAVPLHHALRPVGDLPLVAAMVRQGVLRFIDRARLPMAAIDSFGKIVAAPIECDVYQLTLKGIALCEQHGIKQR